MPFTTNFQRTGIGKQQREAVVQALRTVLANKPGKWHVQFIGHTGETEMRVSGPGIEDSVYLDMSLDPQAVTDAITGILERS